MAGRGNGMKLLRRSSQYVARRLSALSTLSAHHGGWNELSEQIELPSRPKSYPARPESYAIARDDSIDLTAAPTSVLTVDAPTPMDEHPPEVVPAAEEPHVHTLFETTTGTWQWVVADPATKTAVIIDPVLDDTPVQNGISTNAADRILELIYHYKYRVVRILETHTERPHKTSSWYLRTQLRDENGQMPRICTGKSITSVQRMFARQYRQSPEWSKHFDSSFRDGQIFHIGNLSCQVLQARPDCFAFVIGHNVFLGEVPNESSMQRLAGYTTNFYWHPGGGDSSRPATAATAVSEWPSPRPSVSVASMTASAAQPYSPLGAKRTYNQTSTRPASDIFEMA